MRFYGIAEIAAAVSARPATVAQWHKRKRLPKPTVELKMGPMWTAEDLAPFFDKREADEKLKAASSG